MKKVISSFIILCLFACSSSEQRVSTNAPPPFFDLALFFESEIEKLSNQENFRKVTEVNGKTESKNFEKLDFEKELKGFLDSDINKQSWFDKYSIDSTLEAGQLKKLTYQALSEKLNTRKIEIIFQNDKISKITIDKFAETALANAEVQLIYEPKVGYQISNNQNLKVGDKNNFVIKVEFH